MKGSANENRQNLLPQRAAERNTAFEKGKLSVESRRTKWMALKRNSVEVRSCQEPMATWVFGPYRRALAIHNVAKPQPQRKRSKTINKAGGKNCSRVKGVH